MDVVVLILAKLHVFLVHLKFVLDSVFFLHLTWYFWVTKRSITENVLHEL